MNAPERLGLPDALATLSICYAPLIDKHRRAIGTRLTMLSARSPDYLPVGHILQQLNTVWAESDASVLIAPLDATFDDSLLDWQAPANALLEVAAIALRDPDMQRLVQRARRRGIRMALRGRPDVPLPPALTACFEYSLIHIAEDRRRLKDGRARRAPPNAVRRMPFITTGVRRVVDLDEAYERGAMASVGWPIGDTEQRPNCRLRPDQGNLMELLRVASERPDLGGIAQRIRRDPVLAFKLLRMVNSGAFASGEPVTSIPRAIRVLGHDKTLRWLSLSLETAAEHINALPLMRAATLRGLFLEQLAGTVPDSGEDTRDELFAAGAFSLLDRITGAAIPRLLGPVAMGTRVTDAIVHRRGPYAAHLALIEAIERSDPMAIRRHADAMSLPIYDCNQALLRALATTQKLDAEQLQRPEEMEFAPV
ncbi:MAG TPA: HDOD domain-containing protein [Burkholderiaceae bacterium]|nr:HDOD domain-containing protein [Burkholderiaceae bacterium]